MSIPQWRPVGTVRGPQGPPGPAIEVLPFSMAGQLRTATGVGRFPIKGGTYQVLTVGLAVETAPTGEAIVIDVKHNGASIYESHDRRPRIEPMERMGTAGEHRPVVIRDGEWVGVDVLQVGSLIPGRHLTVAVRLQQIVAVDEG